MMKQPIIKNNVRILFPDEIKQIIEVIPKPELKDKFEALLYTGCRYTELQWLYSHKEAHQGSNILMPSMKPKARHKERYVRLNTPGTRAVGYFLRSKKNLPAHTGWDQNLARWAERAGISPKGICCKTTRKTWESWLCTMYPNNFMQICLSQGHVGWVSMEYYLMLPFDDRDKQEMRFYTDGWL